MPEHVKSEMSLNDLESFKNVVNSTNETHNKLIASIQKNVDSLLKERPKTEAGLAGLESRLVEVAAKATTTEESLREAVKREQAEAGKSEERVRNMQAGMRELQERLGDSRQQEKEDKLAILGQAVEAAKEEFGQKIRESAFKLSEVEQLIG